MKKKSPRGIPDFSSKGPKSFQIDKNQGSKPAAKPAFDQPKVKPPSTSQKSGRRGS
jgi:hypothetical protein